MKPSTAFVLTGVAFALAACNNPDANRTTSPPAGVRNPTAIVEPITTPSAPPAPDMRTPVAASANHAAPGTNAQVAFADANEQFAAKPLPSKGGAPENQAQAVNAQEQAAKAPDTAAADEAKEQAMTGENGKRIAGTTQDTAANSPRHGTLTAAEESTQMPKAGQVNNYSDPALEKDSGRPSDGSQASGDQATGDQATGDRATGDHATGDHATGDQASGDQASGDQASGEQPTGDQPTGDQATGDQATGEQPASDQAKDAEAEPAK
jgi:hypothetical protein